MSSSLEDGLVQEFFPKISGISPISGGDLEERMGLFRRKKIEANSDDDKKGPEMNRRKFLGVAGAAAFLGAMGYSSEAHAEVPLAIANDPDKRIASMWSRAFMGGESTENRRVSNRGFAMNIARSLEGTETYFNSPAYHYTRIAMDFAVGSYVREEKIKPKNLALFYFLEGIHEIKSNYYESRKLFLKSVFAAANIQPQDIPGFEINNALNYEGNLHGMVDHFYKSTETDRKQVMNKVVSNARHVGQYQKIQLGWSTFLLSVSFQKRDEDKFKFYGYGMEVPIREVLGYKVRDSFQNSQTDIGKVLFG